MPIRNNRKYKPEDLFEIVADAIVSVRTQESSGSGVLIDAQGVLATNKHIIGNSKKVAVGFKNKSYILGTVIRSYLDTDLAFIKIDISNLSIATSLPFAFYRDKKKLAVKHYTVKVGEPVFAIGHPLGLEYTFTQGIISAVQRMIDDQEYLQIDVSINPGNSGGGLYNAYGDLIGINTMGYAETEGLNFAIPATLIKAKYDEFLNDMSNGEHYYCSVCGFSSKDSQYCENCGASLELEETNEEINQIIYMLNKDNGQVSEKCLMSLVKCQICGVENPLAEKYCSKCGSEL